MYYLQHDAFFFVTLLSCACAVTISPLPYYGNYGGDYGGRGTATFVDSNRVPNGIYQHKYSGSQYPSSRDPYDPCRRVFGGGTRYPDYSGMRNEDRYKYDNGDRYKYDNGGRYYGNEVDRDPYPPLQNTDYYPNFYPYKGTASSGRYPQVSGDCEPQLPARGSWDSSYNRRPSTYPVMDSGRYPGGQSHSGNRGSSWYPDDGGQQHWRRGSSWNYKHTDTSTRVGGRHDVYNRRTDYNTPTTPSYQGRDMEGTVGFWGMGKVSRSY